MQPSRERGVQGRNDQDCAGRTETDVEMLKSLEGEAAIQESHTGRDRDRKMQRKRNRAG